MVVVVVVVENKLDLLHSLSMAIPIIKPLFTLDTVFTQKC